MSRLAFLVPALACGLLLAACGGNEAAEVEPEPTAFEAALDACGDVLVGNDYMSIGEKVPASDVISVDDDALVVDGAGDKYISGQAAGCVLDELDAPAHVRSMIDSTTALMGRQTGAWDDYEAAWSYHPDNGLDLVITSAS